jgi:ketosteroid isomerase-like protein
VEALLADNYIGVSATGRFMTKNTLLAEMRKDKNTYDTATNSGLQVRVHGDTAVVVGTSRQAGKDAAGKAFDYSYRWTDTWARRGENWQCIASQSILVPR